MEADPLSSTPADPPPPPPPLLQAGESTTTGPLGFMLINPPPPPPLINPPPLPPLINPPPPPPLMEAAPLSLKPSRTEKEARRRWGRRRPPGAGQVRAEREKFGAEKGRRRPPAWCRARTQERESRGEGQPDPQGSQLASPTDTEDSTDSEEPTDTEEELFPMVLVDRIVRITLKESRATAVARLESCEGPRLLLPYGASNDVRKEWPEWVDFLLDHDDEVSYFLGVLDGTDPCPPEVADPGTGVTSLSFNIGWPPNRYGLTHPDSAFIIGCHKNLLLLCLGNDDGFYMVYNSMANSIAIVPRRVRISMTHFPIARLPWEFRDLAILRLSSSEVHHDYLLAELLFRTEDRSGVYPTNKATLFLWRSLSASGRLVRRPVCSPYISLTPDKVPPFPQDLDAHALQWIPKEVELPLPTDKDNHPSFRADMTFAAGATTLCWVDLLEGILVYNHQCLVQQQQPFHFIPLPPEAYAVERYGNPQEYRSMCCIKGGALKFVSMEGFNREDISMAEVVLITWILTNPQSPTEWKWHLFESVRIGDLWHNPDDNEMPLLPHFPIISTVEPHVIYLTVRNYKYDPKNEQMEATEVYVLGIDMHLRGVVSAFNASSSPWMMLTPHFTRYLDQITVMEKEVGDEGDPASWASVWISAMPLGVSPVEPAHKAGRLGGRASSGGFAKFISKTGLTMSSISPVVGLQCVLGH